MTYLHGITCFAVLVACLLPVSALPAAEAALPPEVQQRLDLLKTGYESYVLNHSTQPYEGGLMLLNAKVLPVLERERDAAAQRADLDVLVRIKADIERIGKGQALTEVSDAPPAPLKYIYAAYKLEVDKLEAVKKASLAESKRRYDMGLAKVQNELTTAQQVEAALQVKKLREDIAVAPPPQLPGGSGPAVAAQTGSPENLLANGSFQKGTTQWAMTTYEPTVKVTMVVDKKELFHGKETLCVTNPALTDTHISQKVKVKPGTLYRLTGFIKAQDIKDEKGNTPTNTSTVACLSVAGQRSKRSKSVNTDTWTEVSLEYKTVDETELGFECRLGYFSAEVSGTAWFAELALTEVKAAPQAAAGTAGAMAPSSSTAVAALVEKLGGKLTQTARGDEVEINRTELTAADLQQICTDKRLVSFNWNGGKGSLTEEGLAALGGVKKLETLLLWGVGSVTDKGLEHLAGCENLRILSVGANGVSLTGTGFESLAQCQKLESLTLNFEFGVQGANLRHLIKLKALDHLALTACKEVTDADLEWLAQIPSLTYLNLAHTGVTKDGMAKLLPMKNLKELIVSLPLVTEDSVQVLTKANPRLSVIFAK